MASIVVGPSPVERLWLKHLMSDTEVEATRDMVLAFDSQLAFQESPEWLFTAPIALRRSEC